MKWCVFFFSFSLPFSMSHILFPPHSSVCSEWQLLQKACWGPQWNQPQRSCSWPVLVSDSHTQYICYLQYYSAHASGPVKHRTLPDSHCVPFQVWMDGCHSWRSRHEFQGPLPDREMFIKSPKKNTGQQRSVWVLEGQCPAESSKLPQQGWELAWKVLVILKLVQLGLELNSSG